MQTSTLNKQTTAFRERLYKKHNYRGDTDYCPLCLSPIRWVRLSEEWTPCDREPVFFAFDPNGKHDIVPRFKRVFVRGTLYKYGSPRAKLHMGSLPHIYTCDVLRSERIEHAKLLSLEKEMPPR